MNVDNSRYPKSYGAWSGRPEGNRPDYDRCCVEVWTQERWSRAHQCNRKRGHGPEGAYCKQHDPAVEEERKRETAKRQKAKWNEQRYESYGKTFFRALEKIAAGHNDARGLAQEVVGDFKKGEYR